jgi:hypothetical protein
MPGQHLTGPLKEKEKEVDRRKHGGERLERKGNSYDSTHGQRQPDKRKTDQNGDLQLTLVGNWNTVYGYTNNYIYTYLFLLLTLCKIVFRCV